MLNIEFHPSALAEFRQAAIWYNKKQEGLGEEFFEEASNKINVISETPEIWPKYLDHYHRIVLTRFPYSIIYRIKSDFIEIIAIAHQKRKPFYWENRI